MSPGISVVLKGLKFDLHFDVKTSGRSVEPLKCIFQLGELQRSLSRLNEVPPPTLAYILAREGFVVTSSMKSAGKREIEQHSAQERKRNGVVIETEGKSLSENKREISGNEVSQSMLIFSYSVRNPESDLCS
ncbi:hypothetical protein HZH66_000885 [Vespula vulgaris]|uniref:Uncharacterized protein n=1 Tax=Vespula vulgaris TaxID=7454 RepID=A0A834KVE4_VESVU|nr:hypothetical protein HZH66_000885 [Vespula vulgaris]